MKRLTVLFIAGLFAFGCVQPNDAVKRSLNNINEELISIQKTIADLKLDVDEIDKKLQSNTENLNTQSGAISEVRSEINYLSNEVMLLKDGTPRGSASPRAPMNKPSGSSVTGSPATGTTAGTTGGGQQIIIIEDNFTDKSSLYSYAYELYKGGKYDESRAKFNEFLEKYPSDDLADNAMYWIGEIRYSERDYQGALNIFNSLVDEHPEGNKVPDAMLKAALSHDNLGNRQNAVNLLQNLVKKYPDSRAAGIARKQLSEWSVSVQ